MNADFLVVGGGIVGISIAREFRRRHPDCSVALIEKESEVGRHASGRNSGVLHAGFYYSADSLKARFTRQGNLALTKYCEEKHLPLNKCGKLVVAQSASELPALDELLRRAAANGVPLQDITEAEARRIEPRVRTHQRALFSPSTSSVDPVRVVQAMKDDATREGVAIHTGVAFVGKTKSGVRTSAGDWQAGFVVNAAGLYADRVARDFGFSEEYRVLPFKGLYLYSDEPAGALKTNVYPVPDLRNPFLGVHFTVTADGRAKIGPTAIPAFWREQYRLLENFKVGEFFEIAARDLGLLFFAGFDFKRLALTELAKYSKRKMVSLAGALVSDVNLADYRRWGKAGIRAQLYDIKKRKLEMDFVLQGDKRSMHVLNAVSPGFTCALPFAAYVCEEIEKA
ncbi:MAG: L-2-hydroxyglutarate oxidase [Elusimicrobia bacterium]|nr:L-2-hydroxyglutarate oxidase [Elusimicrobiota bacterium]